MSGPFGSQQWAYNAGGDFYSTTIDQSLRFNDDDGPNLTKTYGGSGTSTALGTFSWWMKLGNVPSKSQENIYFESAGYGGIQLRSGKLATNGFDSSNTQVIVETNALLRDSSSWYHCVVSVDGTAGTIKFYINGVEQAQTVSVGSLVAGRSWDMLGYDSRTNFTISNSSSSNSFDGYLAEFYYIDGTALDATSFGETSNGVWVPKQYSGSYGTNGWYLSFADSAAIGDDLSGNTNDWTANNLAASDVVPDSPTNNFATLNPLTNFASVTFADGNLYHNASGNNKGMLANWVLPKSGKWYWEHYSIQFHYATDNEAHFVGINTPDVSLTSNRGGLATAITVSSQSGPYDGSSWVLNVRNGSYGSTGWDENEGVGVVYDADAQTIAWKVNGGTTTTPISVPDGDWIPWVGSGGSTGSEQGVFNFGQDGTFGGRTTSGNYTDANGYGNFKWQPPADALALSTANLPEPTIGPNSTTTGDQNFNTVLYTGDGTNGQAITGVGHQPDLLWIKSRSGTASHELHDSIRGAGARLFSNDIAGESTVGTVSSFDSDGFTVSRNSAYDGTNQSGVSFVGWNWKAGGTAVSNSEGSQSCNVSANTDAGFSIVTWTANAATGTLGHGLNSAPEMILAKPLASGTNWYVMHTPGGVVPANQILNLDSAAAKFTPGNAHFNSTYPTSSVISYGGYLGNALSNDDKVAYCFHSVEGFSKVGSYVGNGSADGTFVYTGFRPRWLMFKDVSNTNLAWNIYYDEASPYNVMNDYLQAATSAAESTNISTRNLDFLSNGFKLRDAYAQNYAASYIYLAFAHAPFKYANAR